jgi:hypothetical protein
VFGMNIWRIRSLGVNSGRCDDNIKMDLRRIGREAMDCIRLPEDTSRWRSLLNTAMKNQI